jgi:hypothetical protein
VTTALNYASSQPLAVGDAWLNVLPLTAKLSAPPVPDVGKPGTALGGQPTTVGQVFLTADQASAYVMYLDGLAPITPLQMRLLLGDPEIQQAYAPAAVKTITLTEQEIAAARKSAQNPAASSKLPAQVPSLVDTSTTSVKVCATVASTADPVAVETVPAPVQSVTGGAAQPVDALNNPVADGFDLVPGHGAVVREQQAPGVNIGTTYLITDGGWKFAVEAGKSLADLGLKGVTAQPFTPGMLRLFPTGPALNELAAAQTIPIAPATASPSPDH